MKLLFAAVSLCITLSANVGHSASPNSDEIRASEIASLFLAYKLVISDSQKLINNPNLGDKGLTGKVIRDKGREKYKELTGRNYKPSNDPLVSQAQVALERAIDKVINDAQPLINTKGVGFKGFITAIFGRRLASEFSTQMQEKASLKFTAPNQTLRSVANRSDDWEKTVFAEKFSDSEWPKNTSYSEHTKDGFRWMVPIYHEEGCLTCHGKPKGSIDITGAVREGAELGDLAGAFSIILK